MADENEDLANECESQPDQSEIETGPGALSLRDTAVKAVLSWPEDDKFDAADALARHR